MLAGKRTPPSPKEVQLASRHVKVKAGGDEQLSCPGYLRNVFPKMGQSGFAGQLLLVSPSLCRRCLPCPHYFVSAKQKTYSYKKLCGLESGSSAVWTCQRARFLAPQPAVFSPPPHICIALVQYFHAFFLAVTLVVHLIKSNITNCPVLDEC